MDTTETEELTPVPSVEERLAEIDEMVASGEIPEAMAEVLRAEIQSPPSAPPASTAPAAVAPVAPAALSHDLQLGSEHEIATRYLKSREHPVVFDRGKLWRYNLSTGVWLPAEKVQSPYGYALTCDGKRCGKTRIKIGHRVAKNVEAIVHHQVEQHNFFADAPVACVFTDGTLILENGRLEFVAHSPDHRAIHSVGISYLDDSKTPVMWLEALDTWLGHFGTEATEYIEMIQEFVGACLFGRGVAYQKQMMLRGEGGDGKSQLAAVIRELFPYNLRSAIKPSSLREQGNGGDDKRAHLAYARINIASDCDKTAFDLSGFKAATGGDEIHCRELREKGFSAVPCAGWIITLNKAFQIGETGRAIRDRIVIIDFLGGCIRGTNRDIKDYGMVIAAKERPLIIRWAVAGFERLLARGHYKVPVSAMKAVDAWIAANNIVGQWAEDSVKKLDHITVHADWASRTSLHTAYKLWCDKNGNKPLASRRFWEALLETYELPARLIESQNHAGERVLPFAFKGTLSKLFS